MLRKLVNLVSLGTLIGFMFSLNIAMAADVTWRMAHKMPPDSPEGKVYQKFADLVDNYSNE